jgi:peptidyl-dipeptidase Dcp
MQDNPLLRKENTHRLKAIPFNEIKLEHFMPAFEEALKLAREEVEALKNNPEPPLSRTAFLPWISAEWN